MEVEPEGLGFSTIFGSMVGSVIVVVMLVAAGMAFAKGRFEKAKLESTQTTGYPVLHETVTKGASQLISYGKTDNGQYTIPIERAMELEALDASK